MQEETRQGQRKEVVSDEPLNWDARIVDGNLVIEPICEEIKRENGRVGRNNKGAVSQAYQ